MKNLNNIEDVISLNRSIEKASKNIILDITLIVAGIILFAASGFVAEISDSLMLSLASIGVLTTFYGLIKLLVPSKNLKYTYSNEPLEKIALSLGNENEQQIMSKINGMDYYSLKKFKPQANNGQNMVIVYITESESIRISQMMNFAHYSYEPTTEPVVKIKEK